MTVSGSQEAGYDIAPFDMEELSIGELLQRLQRGEETSRSLTMAYLERIDALDRRGPTLRAVFEVNPDAVELAEQSDREREAGRVRGPLHGIPILLKDNIDTADRMTTTAGSMALLGSTPPRDAFLVTRLRDAGAVLLGKTNMSEWAGWKSFARGTTGWSGRGWDGGRGGLCRNPYALDRSPGGSSSGSGAACAASFAAAAVGTETDGSIVGPSSRNGLVGIKPTVGLISRTGVIPIAHSQDSAGPMTRSVRDAAILLGVMAAPDPTDPFGAASVGKAVDYTAVLDPNGLANARVGVARAYMGFDERVDRLLEDALDVMRAGGATIVDPIELPEALRNRNHDEMEVLRHEFKADINAYLGSLGAKAPIRSLTELIAFNEAYRDEELGLFPQELLEQSEACGDLTESRYLDALAASHRLSRDEGIDHVMRVHGLDAIVAPAAGIPELNDHTGATIRLGGGCSTPSAMAGYPNMTVPMGHLFGLPVGMALFGSAWSEGTLLRLAFAYEQATHHRRSPRFDASAATTA